MSIPYIENDATEMIATVIDPHEKMAQYLELGLIDHPSDDYSNNCHDMCNISTYAIGQSLLPFCEDGTLMVHEGVFDMTGNHTWLVIEDVIIDATLAQFIPDAKPLSMIKSDWEAYQSVRSYDYLEWLIESNSVA